jgi:hypothetical protein
MLRLKRYKGRPYWIITGTVAGVGIFESSGTADKGLAEQYRLRRERQIYEEAVPWKWKPGQGILTPWTNTRNARVI